MFARGLWSDGDVVVISHAPLLDPPVMTALDDVGPDVSVRSLGEPLSTALASACSPTNVSIFPDAALDVPVHANLVRVPWRHAVAALARVGGCELVVQATPGGRSLVVESLPRALEAASAEARGWFELLAFAGGLQVQVGPEVASEVTAVLNGVAPRRALALTAWACGHQVAERDGVLHVSGDGWLAAEEPVSTTPAVRDGPREADAVAEAARREELEGRVDDLLKAIVQLAEVRKIDDLVAKFSELRQLMTEGGALATEVVRKQLAKWKARLRDLGEVHLSILLQLHVSEGNQLLRAMAAAIRDERFSDVQGLFDRLEGICEEMRAQEREVFHRNAEALYLRGRALRDRSGRLAAVSRLGLHLTATAPGVGAVINGALRRVGDPVLAADGSEIPGLSVVEVAGRCVRLRMGDTEFVRELR